MCVEAEHACVVLEHRRALIGLTHMLSFTRKDAPAAAAGATRLREVALMRHLHLPLFLCNLNE